MTGLELEHLTYNLENFCAHATQLALTIIMNIAKLGTGGGAASRRKPSNVVFFPTIITLHNGREVVVVMKECGLATISGGHGLRMHSGVHVP